MLVPANEDWWESKTMPFLTLHDRKPARFELRQVGDNEFRLLQPFKYVTADGTEIPVTAELLCDTDIASVPSFLGWFAQRHGRHTPAALMHDELITDTPEKLPDELQMPPDKADLLFRQALRASDVPLVKSWVLWTGVTLLTRWRSRFPAKLAIIAWFAIALTGTALLVLGALTGRPALVVVALLAPLPSALLWLPAWPAGIIAGYAFWVVAFGSAPGWVAYKIYQAVEWLTRRLGSLLGRLWRRPEQPTLPPSPSFEKR
jgi:hypothetical protein